MSESSDKENDNRRERRKLRPIAMAYIKGQTEDLPTDGISLSRIQAHILDFIKYCYKRINDKGHVEDEMVDEVRNIGVILKAYCDIKNGDLCSEFYNFNIRLLNLLFKEGCNCNKNQVIVLFERSEILTLLSIFFIQYKTCIFDINLILDYCDTSVEAKNINMLCFMTYQFCSQVKDIKKIRMEELSIDELEKGISLGYFNDKRAELGKYLRELLICKNENDKGSFEILCFKLLRLHILGKLEIYAFSDLVKDHILYRLMYKPWEVDFKTIRLNLFIGLVNVKIRNIVIKYGGYEFYLRVRAAKKRNKNIKNSYIFSGVLQNENFKRIYYENKLAKA